MTDNKITFASTNTRIETIKWYAVEGAPIMEATVNSRGQIRKYSPMAVRLVFVDDGFTDVVRCTEITVNGYPICLDGSLGAASRNVPDINMQDQRNWPEWLHELYKVAQSSIQTALV